MIDSAADSKFARRAWLRALERTASLERGDDASLPVLLERIALERGAAPALVARERTLTFAALAARCNRYARLALAELEPGDCVALVMGNCADYLPAWLGLCRAGVTVALVNPQLEGAALAHSLEIVRPRRIIVDAARAAALAAVRRGERTADTWIAALDPETAARSGAGSLETALGRFAEEPLGAREQRRLPLDAAALYIYTSGTTGLPKAARVSHYRVLQWSLWFGGLLDTSGEDRMYDCLPLYHSVGGVVAPGATLLGGGAVVLRERFSASEFWADVHRERCTLFQYIGELCRYLVNAPPHPLETAHRLRIACGNGLRADVWERFRTRFRMPRILEYYASTEGNFSLYNCEGEPGAIGRIPAFLAARLPVALIRVDPTSGEPRRDAAGFCERCGVDEAGEAVARIGADATTRIGRFEGYLDPEATRRKVLEGVFESGDRWYRTGDLMRRDARGFFYFVDRLGDTFRWKGENVSTAEVAGALGACRGVREVVVYGVEIPGTDGRAGMAALVVGEDFDLARFEAEAAARLPPYARPVFLRLLEGLVTTGTFKPLTRELARAGFDPERIADPLYVHDAAGGGYVRLDAQRHGALLEGKLRL